MFRQFARILNSQERLLTAQPVLLVSMLEDAYDLAKDTDPGRDVGHPFHRSDLDTVPFAHLVRDSGFGDIYDNFPRLWDHLIYAYMIENTRIYEIFRRVLYEYLHGEKLGTPSDADTQAWLRTTEELFYKDGAPFLITSVTSHIRQDLRASRRNAYQRMFGMDLNHGADDGKPYAYVRAEAANSEFVATFEEFLREVWVGMTYFKAETAKPTDDSKIAVLATKLHDMLRSRRQNGNLSREEFAFVSMMAWFHLALEFNSPIVRSLRADATGVEQRLFKIAERVGLPAHGLSKSFFDIADPMSRILIEIEKDVYRNPAAVPALYTPSTQEQPNGVESAMRTIITHWTAITGRDVKARKVAAN